MWPPVAFVLHVHARLIKFFPVVRTVTLLSVPFQYADNSMCVDVKLTTT